ncbi:ribonuclease E/G [Fusobacterium massiliense]|uniref:ribonuclease E/G n=1 Tax=Fusobacterium massiliense TaxID=1852365 RepID=UPI0028F000E3|nr:ribonuclease E/G [Fusobacterium massiliense]
MQRLIFNKNKYEIKIAYTVNEKLEEIYISNIFQKEIIGNIYKGKVVDILNEGKIVFLDIGLEKNAFLSFEKKNEGYLKEKISIGDNLIVQVLISERDNKGAKVSLDYSINSKNMVLLPYSNGISISKKIKDEAKKEKLKKFFEIYSELEEKGIIFRTSSENVDLDVLEKEYKKILETNIDITKKFNQKKIGLLFDNNIIIDKVLNKKNIDEVDEIITNDEETYSYIKEYLEKNNKFEILRKMKKYFLDENIFQKYNIKKQIDTALSKKVWLQSGGYLIIEKTEALVSIDVNTGRSVSDDLEKTIFQTNLEASEEIARQVKLRNLSGIIIIDFINMRKLKYKKVVLDNLKENLKKDSAETYVFDYTELDLVQMTRKNEGKYLFEYYLDKKLSFNESEFDFLEERIILNLIEELDYLKEDKDIKNIKIKISKNLEKILEEVFKKEFFIKNIVIENDKNLENTYKIELYK